MTFYAQKICTIQNTSAIKNRDKINEECELTRRSCDLFQFAWRSHIILDKIPFEENLQLFNTSREAFERKDRGRV